MSSESNNEGRLPEFLVVGPPKCGTTSLANALDRHPGVFVPDIKEIGYFHRDDHWERGDEWYRSHFRNAPDGAVVGEATPFYLASERASERIAAKLPETRIIAVLRDPVDRAHSHFVYRRRSGLESRDMAVAFEASLEQNRDGPAGDYLVGQGFYAHHLQRYEAFRERGLLKVFIFERFIDKPKVVLGEIQQFLGVSTRTLKLEKDNPSRAPRSVLIRDLLNAVIQSKGLVKKFVKGVTSRSTRLWIKDLLEGFNMTPREKPPLEEGIADRLRDVYRADIRALQEKFDLPVDMWWERADSRPRQ